VPAVVVIVSVDVPELLAMDAGLKAQVTPAGNPGAQVSATDWLNPKVGDTFIVEVTELPAVTGDNALAESANPGGVVLNKTLIPLNSPSPRVSEPVINGRTMMSGSPSPFISAKSAGVRAGPIIPTAGTEFTVGEKVPSPFPN
jgi:hypothetical protein